MEGGLIKLIVLGVFLLLSWIGKGLEKKAQSPQRGSPAPRKSGLDMLAELERKLREAQRAAETGETPRSPEPGKPPVRRIDRPGRVIQPQAARPKPPPRVVAAPPDPAPPASTPSATAAPAAFGGVSARHLDTLSAGLRAHHLQESVDTRHLDLDLTQAREGHAALLDARPETDDADTLRATVERRAAAAAMAGLPARLTELQRALVWSELLARPVALRDQ